MDNSPQSERAIKRLEFKMNIVLGLCVFQAFLLAMIVTAVTLSKVTYYLTFFMVVALLAVFVYFFRRQIPGWFGSMSRAFFAQMLTTKSDSNNEK